MGIVLLINERNEKHMLATTVIILESRAAAACYMQTICFDLE